MAKDTLASLRAELLELKAAFAKQTLALAATNGDLARTREEKDTVIIALSEKITFAREFCERQRQEILRLRAAKPARSQGVRPAYKHQPSPADIASHEAFEAKRAALRALAKQLGRTVTDADLN